MKSTLEIQGFTNVLVMPNCKKLNILSEKELVYPSGVPYRLCTFSRAMKEKGIEIAINAVRQVNNKLGFIAYTLDIYGQVDNSQIEWFEMLNKRFPNYVRYCGYVDSDKTVEVLKQYFALLFPTYYAGEGFAGTVIDAFASGVPVIASDWKYNTEIIKVGFDGAVFPAKDTQALVDKLVEIYRNIDAWNAMKLNCLKRAKDYSSENVIRILIEQLY
jgi:glycosyltransferase involved in cell wall biosynthesis